MKSHTRSTAPSRIAHRVAALALASSLLVLSASAGAAATNDEPAASAPIAARWVPRKIHFMYSAVSASSSTTYYSCDRLQGEISAILRQLGARDEVVKPFGCMTGGGPERFPGVDARFSVLEPAGSGAEGATSSKEVEARWDRVTLSASDASCALIDQVRRSILPLFATRDQTSGCSPHLSVEVLRPVHSSATRP